MFIGSEREAKAIRTRSFDPLDSHPRRFKDGSLPPEGSAELKVLAFLQRSGLALDGALRFE